MRSETVTTVLDVPRERVFAYLADAVALPDGRTAYSFTMFQGPGTDDGLFEAQYASLQREFGNIERIFAG